MRAKKKTKNGAEVVVREMTEQEIYEHPITHRAVHEAMLLNTRLNMRDDTLRPETLVDDHQPKLLGSVMSKGATGGLRTFVESTVRDVLLGKRDTGYCGDDGPLRSEENLEQALRAQVRDAIAATFQNSVRSVVSAALGVDESWSGGPRLKDGGLLQTLVKEEVAIAIKPYAQAVAAEAVSLVRENFLATKTFPDWYKGGLKELVESTFSREARDHATHLAKEVAREVVSTEIDQAMTEAMPFLAEHLARKKAFVDLGGTPRPWTVDAEAGEKKAAE